MSTSDPSLEDAPSPYEALQLTAQITELHAAGQISLAAAAAERLLEIREAELGKDHSDVADLLADLGDMHTDMGSYDRGRALLERCVASLEAAHGRDSVTLV